MTNTQGQPDDNMPPVLPDVLCEALEALFEEAGCHDIHLPTDASAESLVLLGARIREALARKSQPDASRTRHQTLEDWQAWLALVPQPLYWQDPEGRFLGFSDAAKSLLGDDCARLIGKTGQALFQADEAQFHAAKDRILLAKGGSQHYEQFSSFLGAPPRYLSFSKTVWTDASGQPAGIIGMMHDLTALKQAQATLAASQRELKRQFALAQAVFDDLPLPLITTDRQGKFARANRAMLQLWGANDRDQLASLLQPADLPYDRHVRQIRPLSTAAGDRYMLHLDGPLNGPFGEFLGAIGVRIDITEQRQEVLDLGHARERAEASHTDALASSRALSSLLKGVETEVRSRLNIVVNLTELLSETCLATHQTEWLTEVRNSAIALRSIAEQIQEYARMDPDEIRLVQEAYALSDLVTDLVRSLESDARRKSIRLLTSIDQKLPDRVMGDSLRVQQVLSNLLSNALKFTEQGSVEVSLRVFESDVAPPGSGGISEHAGPWVMIDVSDSGAGMSAPELAALWVSDTAATGTDTLHRPSSPIGLGFTRDLVGLMGGTISATSTPGQGSRFTLRLPMIPAPRSMVRQDQAPTPVVPAPVASPAPALVKLPASHPVPAAAQGQPPAADPMPRSGSQVLVAEDIAVNQVLIRTLLERIGLKVTIAGDGQAALDELEFRHFDVVLMDLHMPVLDGLEATRQIRQQEHGQGRSGARHLPVIGLTAYAMPTDREACLDAGMDCVITKPIDRKLLYATLARFLPDNRSEAAAPAVSSAS